MSYLRKPILSSKGSQRGSSWRLVSRGSSIGEQAPTIAGTEGADMYFAVSPDGKSVAFSTLNDRLIKKVSLSGGIPTPLGPTLGRFSYVTTRAHSYTRAR